MAVELARPAEAEPIPMRVADIFPGQGFDPEVLVENATSLIGSAKARRVIVETNEILGDVFPGGRVLSEIFFQTTSVERAGLILPQHAQPAMLAVSMAALAAFEELGGKFGNQKPDAVAGHSAGTVGALVRAGVLSFEDGLLVARKRGEAMDWALDSRTDRGTMVAILGRDPIDEDALRRFCDEEGVVLANINSSTAMIISGSLEGTRKVAEKVEKPGVKVRQFAIGAAYHNPEYMHPAVERFRREIQNIKFNDTDISVYLNSTGMPLKKGADLKNLLPNEIENPVNWVAVINNMRESGIEVVREFGGKTLTSMLQRTDPILQTNAISIDTIDAAKQVRSFARAQ